MAEVFQSMSSGESLALAPMLSALRESGAHNYDPVRFSFIEAMAARVGGRGEAVGSRVDQAAQKALHEYRTDLTLAQEEAKAFLNTSDTVLAEELQQLFQACKYREMKRLLARPRRSRSSESLAALSAYISIPQQVFANPSVPPSFDDILRQQEQELLQSGGNSSAIEGSEDESVLVAGPVEHRSIHHFRETLVKRNADKLVTQLIKDIPEDAGPLNPQKLIVQSLASMRDLSPHYLNRFVAYIDTLLWLEKSGGK